MYAKTMLLLLATGVVMSNTLFAAPAPVTKTPTKPDINSITDNINGPTVQTTADGTKVINNQDGSSVQIHPDGSLFITNSDGTTVQKKS